MANSFEIPAADSDIRKHCKKKEKIEANELSNITNVPSCKDEIKYNILMNRTARLSV